MSETLLTFLIGIAIPSTFLLMVHVCVRFL